MTTLFQPPRVKRGPIPVAILALMAGAAPSKNASQPFAPPSLPPRARKPQRHGARVMRLDELVDGFDQIVDKANEWAGNENTNPGGGEEVSVPEFGGYNVPSWLASAYASNVPPEQLASSLSDSARKVVIALCAWGTVIPIIGTYLLAVCFALKQIDKGIQQAQQCPPGQMPYEGQCVDQRASQGCDGNRGYVDPVSGMCVQCGPGYRFDPDQRICVEGCPPEAPVLSPRFGCVATQFNSPCTLGDGSRGVYGPSGDCVPDGCGPGQRYDMEAEECVPDASVPPKPEDSMCNEYGAGWSPFWDASSGQWACGGPCGANEVKGQGGYCFCKAGYQRQNPNDVNSPCVPIATKPTNTTCPPYTKWDPAAGACVKDQLTACPEGQVRNAMGECVDEEKPSSEKKDGFPWGIVAGVALVAAAGGLVYMSSQSPEKKAMEARVAELKAQGKSEQEARAIAEREMAAKKAAAPAPQRTA